MPGAPKCKARTPDFRRPSFLLMNGIGLIPLRGGALSCLRLFVKRLYSPIIRYSVSPQELRQIPWEILPPRSRLFFSKGSGHPRYIFPVTQHRGKLQKLGLCGGHVTVHPPSAHHRDYTPRRAALTMARVQLIFMRSYLTGRAAAPTDIHEKSSDMRFTKLLLN